jgi:hypothetical protein
VKISIVPPEMVEGKWEEISLHLVSPVQQSGGRFTLEDVFHNIATGNYHLWVAIDETIPEVVAVCVTGFTPYPQKRMLTCHFLGGGRMDEWVEEMDQVLEKWGRQHGAEGIELTGRKGWGRALEPLGWQTTFFITEKSYE